MRIVLLLSLLVGCGAKTLPGEPAAGGGRDAGRDGATDALTPDVGAPDAIIEIDAEACGGDCDDSIFCNGREVCTVDGCVSLGLACEDGDLCTEDSCDERTDSCSYRPADVDRDGDMLTGCDGDCDDTDARIFPGATEVCDFVDQDCDGRVDEGTRSQCRDCRPGCMVVTLPNDTGTDWESIATEMEGVEVAPDGSLILGSSRTESDFAWISNTEFGTVTKLDLTNGAQLAEYDSVLLDGSNDGRPPGEVCMASDFGGAGAGNCPSRTAVDLRGNVYVANRAFENQGTVTKIAGNEEDCIDRNGNGRIDTTRDDNGNGVIDPGELRGQVDECLLWTVNVGAPNSIPRAIAIDAEGLVWVGLNGEQRVLALDPSDGEVERNVSLRRDNFSPYGAAIASDGTLWLVEGITGRITSIDTRTAVQGPVEIAESRADGCRGSYGIAIDELDRVWLAGIICPVAFRWDPIGRRWFEVALPDSGATRGIAADDRGFIYVGSSNEWITFSPLGVDVGPAVTRLTRFRADDGSDLQIFGTEDDPLPGLGTVGVGLDKDRNVWMINQESGSATRVNPDTGESREFAVGSLPYTYSDFTGFALRTFTVPNGFLRTTFEGCAVGPTEWEQLTWDATVRRSTRIEVRIRTAGSEAALRTATWLGPFTEQPVDLSLPPGPPGNGRFMEVEIVLVSEDEETSPRLQTLDVQFNCPTAG